MKKTIIFLDFLQNDVDGFKGYPWEDRFWVLWGLGEFEEGRCGVSVLLRNDVAQAQAQEPVLF